MGLFGLFGGNKKITPTDMVVNIGEKGIEINGTEIMLPCSMKQLKKLLGTPREVVYQTPKSEIDPNMLAQFPHLADKRVNYAWDELGVYCYTSSDGSVNCIGIKHIVRQPLRHDPKNMYAGMLTVLGRPWYEAARLGADMEVYRQVFVGRLSATFEYADFSHIESLGTEDDYTGIEVQLKREV